MKRIIVPLDGTEHSESILPVVRGLADQIPMQVTLVSVLDVPVDYGWADTPQVRDVDATSAAIEERQRYLQAQARQLGDVHVDIVVRLGKAAEQILDVADEHAADLIAISTRAHSGVRRFFVGSVTSRVLQGAACPVLVSRYAGEGEGAELLDVNRVLVPLDGSAFGAQRVSLHLVQVIEAFTFTSYDEFHSYSAPELRQITDRAAEVAREYLGSLASRLEHEFPKVTWEVYEATDVVNGIQSAARSSGVDLIAMATHGRSGLGRFVFGSVAERTLQNVDFPILMVRSSE